MHPAPSSPFGPSAAPQAGQYPGQAGGFGPPPGAFGPAGFAPPTGGLGPGGGFGPGGAAPGGGNFGPPAGGPPHLGPGPASAPTAPPTNGVLAATLSVVSVVLVALGLSIPFTSSAGWVTQTAWAIFAMLAAIAAAVGPLLSGSARSPGLPWLVTAIGTGALAGYWVLIVLPSVSSNQGFAITLGVACAGLSCWFSPLRPQAEPGR